MSLRWCLLGGFVVVCLVSARWALTDAKTKDLDSKAASADAERRRTLIQSETAQLVQHPWAGEYYKGDGLGENSSLSISPEQGYVFEWHGCLGLYDRNYGNVTVKGNELHLEYTFPSQRRRGLGLAPILVPVIWGTRHYLVPNDEMIRFCNSVNSGSERNGDAWSFFLRQGDPPEEPTGLPKVPEEFDSYLLRKPVEAQILSVGQYTIEPGLAETKFYIYPVKIDAGSASGLQVGMELDVLEPPSTFQTVEITKVEQNQSEGVIEQMDDDRHTPVVGSRLSTRNPLYDRLRESRGE